MRKSRFTEEQMVTVLREADRTNVSVQPSHLDFPAGAARMVST